MDIAHLFTDFREYQFEAHTDGSYTIVTRGVNSGVVKTYSYDGLQDFLVAYQEILRKERCL